MGRHAQPAGPFQHCYGPVPDVLGDIAWEKTAKHAIRSGLLFEVILMFAAGIDWSRNRVMFRFLPSTGRPYG